MIGAMSDNVANYRAVAALPSFSLFPWFFVLPGLLVVGLTVAAGSHDSRSAEPSPLLTARDGNPLSEGAS